MLKKFPVAVAITAAVVALCIVYSLFLGPVPAVKVHAGDWLLDSGNVLSEAAEASVRTDNAAFDSSYGSVIAVVTVNSTRGWTMEDYTLNLADQWQLGKKDLLLLLDVGGKNAYLMEGGNWPGLDCTQMLSDNVAADFNSGDYDSAVLKLFSAMKEWYAGHAAAVVTAAPSGGQPAADSSGGAPVVMLILALVVVYLILASAERRRYRRWYRSYGHMPNPSVFFVPIFPWHRPGSWWFRRRMRTPPIFTHTDFRGNGPFGPFGPGSFGGRGGGFGTRGGGFGGHGSGFGGRGGGFGGHGGGFGGRGGGFGGRR